MRIAIIHDMCQIKYCYDDTRFKLLSIPGIDDKTPTFYTLPKDCLEGYQKVIAVGYGAILLNEYVRKYGCTFDIILVSPFVKTVDKRMFYALSHIIPFAVQAIPNKITEWFASCMNRKARQIDHSSLAYGSPVVTQYLFRYTARYNRPLFFPVDRTKVFFGRYDKLINLKKAFCVFADYKVHLVNTGHNPLLETDYKILEPGGRL